MDWNFACLFSVILTQGRILLSPFFIALILKVVAVGIRTHGRVTLLPAAAKD